jgi:hypothetical protein
MTSQILMKHEADVFGLMSSWWEGGSRSIWIENRRIAAYVRRGPLYFGGLYWDGMTLANISVRDTQEAEKTGHAAPVLSWMSNICPAPLLMVDQILSPRLEDILKRRGWCFVYCLGHPVAYRLRADLGKGRLRP